MVLAWRAGLLITLRGPDVIDSGLRKLADIELYRDPRYHCAFPSVVSLPDGGALLTFRRARDVRWLLTPFDEEGGSRERLRSVDHIDSRSHLVVLPLDRELKPLAAPSPLPSDPDAADQDVSLLRLSDGRLLLSSFAWYPVPAGIGSALRQQGVSMAGKPDETGCLYLFWGGFTSSSSDNGASWEERRYLPPLPGAEDVVPGRRPRLGGAPSGTMAEHGEKVYLGTYGRLHGSGECSCHLWSAQTSTLRWQHRGVIAEDASGKVGFYEPSIYATSTGELVAFMRTRGGDDRLATARSRDGGNSWSPWKLHQAMGHPWYPLQLQDGRVLLVTGYRHEPYGIRARLLNPECTNIDEVEELVIRDDGVGPDLGYPAAAQLADGRVVVVYYLIGEDGVRHIAASLLEV